jgi:hypothetical protein
MFACVRRTIRFALRVFGPESALVVEAADLPTLAMEVIEETIALLFIERIGILLDGTRIIRFRAMPAEKTPAPVLQASRERRKILPGQRFGCALL